MIFVVNFAPEVAQQTQCHKQSAQSYEAYQHQHWHAYHSEKKLLIVE
jgi:hypothetical protein